MKIQLASDLHLEHLQARFPGERVIEPAPEADLLVLAGDIAEGELAWSLFADWPVPVLYVAGNHEFYRADYGRARQALQQPRPGHRVRLLDEDEVHIDGVRILGCTLWTDYELDPSLAPQAAMDYARLHANDHRYIAHRGAIFMPEDALAEHRRDRAWLAARLACGHDGPTVVITHHAPHPLSVHARFRDNPLNPAFVSNLEDMLPAAQLWLHGHVHDNMDYRVGGCRVVANPRGYAFNKRAAATPADIDFENKAFKPALVLPVPG
ncbi:MAG: hypothetical protein JWP36_2836 [Paucimonas sp.]|nr:hypothetical protein [Paucimonas sp.]